jgi:hypothetical protein
MLARDINECGPADSLGLEVSGLPFGGDPVSDLLKVQAATRVNKSLAPLKKEVRYLLRESMSEETRERLLGNLLEEAYFAAIVDLSNERLEELRRAKS